MATPAAGWYEDPAGGGGQRYWDGARWTDQTRPSAPAQLPPPVPEPGTMDGSDVEAVPEQAPGGARRGPLIAGGVAVLVFALAVAAVVLSGALSDGEEQQPVAAQDIDAEDGEAEEHVATDQEADVEDEPDGPADDVEPEEPLGPFADSGTVTILHPLTGETDTRGLRAMLQDFARRYPDIEVIEQGSADFEQLARSRIEGGNAPDIVLHPQPELAREFWQQGLNRSLEDVVDVARLRGDAVPGLVDTMTFAGRVVGVPVRVSPKSIVWYSPRTFEAGAYEVPRSWDQLMALTRAMADDDLVEAPWCIGIESGDATGWVATDWIEDLLLRAEGADVYDAWTVGDLAFESPQVQGTIERYLEPIWFNDDFVLGGRRAITEVSFGDAVLGLHDDAGGCGLHRQAGFIEGFFDQRLQYGSDYDFFALPPIDPAHGAPVVGAGDFAVLYTDNAAANTLMAWLARAEAGEAWAATAPFVSPFGAAFEDASYQRPIDRQLHDVVSQATVFRFDASDQMPRAVGASSQPGSFWVEITRWIEGERELRAALAEIDRTFAASP